VLVVAFYLADGFVSDNLVRAILEHDGYEHITGDIPATAKWLGNMGEILEEIEEKVDELYNMKFKAYETLTPEEKILLKVADMAELCCRASAESLMGNRFMQVVFQNGSNYLFNIKEGMPKGVWEKLDAILGPGREKAVGTTPPAH
jgi:5'-deoxynucleotidase YfbR-like HD superfamily hydrolase